MRGFEASGAAALEALRAAGLKPLVLEAKEGLSLVNGTPCATGMTALALLRIERLLDWADLIGAMSFENLHGQVSAFEPEGLSLRGLSGALAGGRTVARRSERQRHSGGQRRAGVRRIH